MSRSRCQHKMNSNDTFVDFGFVLPCLGIVFMIGLLLIYFDFHLYVFVCVCLCVRVFISFCHLFLKRQGTWCWTDLEVGRTLEELGKGKSVIRMYCMKIF